MRLETNNGQINCHFSRIEIERFLVGAAATQADIRPDDPDYIFKVNFVQMDDDHNHPHAFVGIAKKVA